MVEILRIILLAGLAAAARTTAGLTLAWWLEPHRRLRRALDRTLNGPAEVEAVSPAQGRACAVDFESDQVVVLWDRGANGLIYEFAEIDGAEMIVDGHVLARVRRGEPRRELDVMAPDAGQVVLRLIFADARHPEFELDMWNSVTGAATGSPAEALRLGRKWLSHVEMLLK